ncbi:MAG: fasciclin domain-containing protein [Patescibacteria group bacterium]
MNSQEQGVMVGGAMMVPSKNIVENAMNANNVKTVVAAVVAAGLAETLSGKGPFTVFAPTDAAFNKLPAGTVETLVQPENKANLTAILTYHVVSGAWKASDIKEGEQMVKTVNGKELKITKKDGKVWVNNAMVEIADVISSNGVTHVIDTVLMP